MDASRTALRLGADSVTVLYRRSREEMPALDEEVEEALEEGIEMHFLAAPVAAEGNGAVSKLRYVRMELGEADESGRRRPVPVPGSESEIAADHVIVAIGQRANLTFAEGDDRGVVKDNLLSVHPVTQRTAEAPVFAGGDAVTGPLSIIEAVGAGQRAAVAIDVMLGGEGRLREEKVLAEPVRPGESVMDIPRQVPPAHAAGPASGTWEEMALGYATEVACLEGRRCLRCDLE
jgi:NADPH-dependent glutamate synthase beta subunit-like oxidoreductase